MNHAFFRRILEIVSLRCVSDSKLKIYDIIILSWKIDSQFMIIQMNRNTSDSFWRTP